MEDKKAILFSLEEALKKTVYYADLKAIRYEALAVAIFDNEEPVEFKEYAILEFSEFEKAIDISHMDGRTMLITIIENGRQIFKGC